MNDVKFTSGLLNFIRENKDLEPSEIVLKGVSYEELAPRVIAELTSSARKMSQKLPEWYNHENIWFPPALSIEQSSSIPVARHKASVVSGEMIVDLTGGLGVDSYAFSHKFKNVIYVEKKPELCEIAKHNFQVLGRKNIEVINSTAEDFIKNTNIKCDWIYLDPSRRDENRKVFRIEDCSPDLNEILPKMVGISKNWLIKLSPLLDITEGIRLFGTPLSIKVVSVDNDCKELLFVRDVLKKKVGRVEIESLDLGKNNYSLTFNFNEEINTEIEYSDEGRFLYLPGTSITKAGAFIIVASKFGLKKASENTHIYFSDRLIEDFPGRCFQVVKNFKNKREIVSSDLTKGVNIIVKNYTMKPSEVAKKYKIKEGGEDYLIGYRNRKDKPVHLLANKIS